VTALCLVCFLGSWPAVPLAYSAVDALAWLMLALPWLSRLRGCASLSLSLSLCVCVCVCLCVCLSVCVYIDVIHECVVGRKFMVWRGLYRYIHTEVGCELRAKLVQGVFPT